MKLFKKVINAKVSKNHISLFIMIFLMNNPIAFSSENKSYPFQNKKKDAELEEIYRIKSIPYIEYDGLGAQLKTFFGLYSPKSDINNYPDLSIINNSDSIRESYRLKLNDMTINKTNNKIKKDTLLVN